VTYENYIKGRMVQFAVAEAYHVGGWDAMCAVAQVLANRVKNGWGEWYDVLDRAGDYRGTVNDPPKVDPRAAEFRRMLTMIDDIYHGLADDTNVNVEDDRGGKTMALYYADLNNLNRAWFRENVLSNLVEHPRLATVGPLTFFA
jgi:hypothetical protein